VNGEGLRPTNASLRRELVENSYSLVHLHDRSATLSFLLKRQLCLSVLIATATFVGLAAETRPTLIVRLYNTAGVPAAELVDARNAADAILRDTGMRVMFRQCGRRASPGDAVDLCEQPLQRSEVVVRIIDAPEFNATLHPDAYGVTYIVKETNRGWLATVFSDRIHSAAERVGAEPGTLLGRVVAHEVGHLLLGSGYHGTAGVMRAEWPDTFLTRGGEAWRFSMHEAERMRQIRSFN
jgi:hypothetical protein